MALYIKPKGDPHELTQALVAAAMHGSPRRVPGWILISEHADFSLAVGDVKLDQRASLRPQVHEGQVVLHFHWRPGVEPDSAVYAAYHARFVELVLTYFTDRYELISVS